MSRLRAALHLTLIALDQLAQVVIAGALYVAGRSRIAPNPDETISSRVGRAAVAGKRWGLALERLIDAIMGAGHCRASIGT